MPKLTSKKGKEVQAKLDAAPRVSSDELNQCIGYNGGQFRRIGFSENNEEYFGFLIGDDWDVKIPDDCEEVTYSRYKELFSNDL